MLLLSHRDRGLNFSHTKALGVPYYCQF